MQHEAGLIATTATALGRAAPRGEIGVILLGVLELRERDSVRGRIAVRWPTVRGGCDG